MSSDLKGLLVYSLGTEERPVKLVVGGVHGREWRTVSNILKEAKNISEAPKGRTVIVPCVHKGKKYVSTLSSSFIERREGKKLISLIKRYGPELYVEVHCYRRSAYRKLTEEARWARLNVPPLRQLEEGVLIGAVSYRLLPYLHGSVPILLEVPCGCSDRSKLALLKVLKMVVECKDSDDFLKRMKDTYSNIGEVFLLLEKWASLIKDKLFRNKVSYFLKF